MNLFWKMFPKKLIQQQIKINLYVHLNMDGCLPFFSPSHICIYEKLKYIARHDQQKKIKIERKITGVSSLSFHRWYQHSLGFLSRKREKNKLLLIVWQKFREKKNAASLLKWMYKYGYLILRFSTISDGRWHWKVWRLLGIKRCKLIDIHWSWCWRRTR